MKKIIFSAIGIIGFVLFTGGVVFAHEMMNNVATGSESYTAHQEAEGKIVWEKLQAKQIQCSDLSDDDFEVLGEYFMGQMTGPSHEAMNNMMIQMMDEKGEKQMHIVMGKRLSGCDTSATFPSKGVGFMPMMNMMWGGWSSPFGSNSTNNLINFGFKLLGGLGWIFIILMILWGILPIVGIVALIKWLTNRSRTTHHYGKSPLEILKERYAKGEIDKEEFEDKKKDLINTSFLNPQ